MSASPRRAGELVLSPQEVREIEELTDDLADGLGGLSAYRPGESIPPESWGPVAAAAARLVKLLEDGAVKMTLARRIVDAITPHALRHLEELSLEEDQDPPALH